MSIQTIHTLPVLGDLARLANEAHHKAEGAAVSALEHARDAGAHLADAKNQCRHGEWLPWLRANFAGSQRTANDYMRVAAHWERLNWQRAANLTVRGALAELAEPRAQAEASEPANDSQARALGQFDADLQPDIMRHAARLSDEIGKPVTAGFIERVGGVFEEAQLTGHVDIGDGTSTPLEAALTVEAFEHMQRQKQRIREHYDEHDARGHLTPEAKEKRPHVSHNSGDNEWYTPPDYIEAARSVMGGIDLDPASSPVANERVRATLFFTAEDNGLSRAWGGRVWMNPPVCGCNAQPKVVLWEDGNQDLPELQAGLAAHLRALLAEGGYSVPLLVVQGLRSGEGAVEAAGTAELGGGEARIAGGEGAVLRKREGQGDEAAAVRSGQSQEAFAPSIGSLPMGAGELDSGATGVGPFLRLLRSDGQAFDAGSFHSFVESCVSGHNAGEYGSGLPELQFGQGATDADGLARGQAACCPNCGLVGYSVGKPVRVFMNPPYAGDLIGKFCEKLAGHYEDGTVTAALVLVNNATETQWFQRLATLSSSIAFPKGRVRFLDPEGNPGAPLQGQAVIYLGDKPEHFAATFSPFGFVR